MRMVFGSRGENSSKVDHITSTIDLRNMTLFWYQFCKFGSVRFKVIQRIVKNPAGPPPYKPQDQGDHEVSSEMRLQNLCGGESLCVSQYLIYLQL